MSDVLLGVIGVLAFCFMVSAVLGIMFPKLGHKLFSWHHVKKPNGFDGASIHGICVICHKDCMQDSQGNWF